MFDLDLNLLCAMKEEEKLFFELIYNNIYQKYSIVQKVGGGESQVPFAQRRSEYRLPYITFHLMKKTMMMTTTTTL